MAPLTLPPAVGDTGHRRQTDVILIIVYRQLYHMYVYNIWGSLACLAPSRIDLYMVVSE